ncbi:MAG: hypothetical protein ACP5IM_04235 [Candidatus Bathyarchaeia archaeon]
MSLQRKRRRSIIDELFGTSMFEEFPEEASEGGYSISVVQTPEGTKVKAKVGKDVDVSSLRKQLQREYPNAQIEIEGGKTEPLIREISTKTFKKENQKEERGK